MKPNPDETQNPGFAHPNQPVISIPEAGRGAGGGGDYNNPIHRTQRVSHGRGAVAQPPAKAIKKK